VPALGDEDVGGLNVTMDDASGVRGVQCICDFNGQRQQTLCVQWPSGNAMLQRHAVQKLHRDKGLVSMLADLVNGADVRMI
jgi:hypothetical protein